MVAAAAASAWVNVVHFSLSVKHRKLAKLPYPAAYASEEKANADDAAFKFNCGKSTTASSIVLRLFAPFFPRAGSQLIDVPNSPTRPEQLH